MARPGYIGKHWVFWGIAPIMRSPDCGIAAAAAMRHEEQASHEKKPSKSKSSVTSARGLTPVTFDYISTEFRL
jgi:hypothetical protein